MIDNPDGQGPQQGPAWSVIRIEDQTSYTPGKGAVRVKRVYFRLYDGSESYEDFPAAGFKVSDVEKGIDAKAQELARVLQLRGAEITYGAS